jgi:acyl-CoA synthetase (AMP-forming)/AMP-acid ligase II
MSGATKPPGGNPFLDPILSRWRVTPETLVGVFHDGDDWHSVHMADFMRRAMQYSELLTDSGVMAEDVVLVILHHGLEAHAAFFGAMIIGAVPSFMPFPNTKQDKTLYWRQHEHVFKHINPRAILAYHGLRESVSEAVRGSDAIILHPATADAKTPALLGHVPGASAIALLQHSSGTTGLKKGVQLSYQAINDQLEAYAQALRLHSIPEKRFASWLPLYHDMGLITSFLMPLWLGVPIVSLDPFEWTKQPSLLFDAIQDYRATHIWLPNFALLHHVRSARGSRTWDLSSLVAIVCCSEPCKPEAFDAFLERFSAWGVRDSALQTSYAMAETVFAVTQSSSNKSVRRLRIDRTVLQTQGRVVMGGADEETMVLLSNGPPISRCEVRILRDGAFVDERVIGEICIMAPWLFSGYYKNPDATQDAFQSQWLRSGDLGFLDKGELFIIGRIKDVIIVNGKNIFAHDVEAAVSRVPNIKPGRAVAFGHYVATLGSEELVVVAERLDSAADQALVCRLVNHAVLEEVGVGCGDVRLVEQGWLVKTTSGKLSRSENLSKYVQEFLRGAGGTPELVFNYLCNE